MMFIKLPMGNVTPSDPQYGKLLQEGCADIIQCIANFEGMLAHISYDDKGVSFTLIILLLFKKILTYERYMLLQYSEFHHMKMMQLEQCVQQSISLNHSIKEVLLFALEYRSIL